MRHTSHLSLLVPCILFWLLAWILVPGSCVLCLVYVLCFVSFVVFVVLARVGVLLCVRRDSSLTDYPFARTGPVS